MTPDLDLRRLERDSFRSTYDDGLPDLVVGLWLAGLGVGMATDLDFLPAAMFALVFPTWLILRKRVTQPRIGAVRFARARVELERLKKRGLLVVSTLSLLAGVGAFFLFESADGGWFRDLGPIPFGFMLALGTGLVGVLYGMYRFTTYALLVLLAFALPFRSGHEPDAWVAAIGGLVAVIGVLRLLRFLRDNPRPDGAESLVRP